MSRIVIVVLINQSHKSIDLASYVKVYSRRDWCGGYVSPSIRSTSWLRIRDQ
jgi:hypothetical protein